MDHEFDDNQIEDLRIICEQIYDTNITTEDARKMSFQLYGLSNILTQLAHHPDFESSQLKDAVSSPNQQKCL